MSLLSGEDASLRSAWASSKADCTRTDLFMTPLFGCLLLLLLQRLYQTLRLCQFELLLLLQLVCNRSGHAG